MEKQNKRIAYEYLLVNKAFQSELGAMGTDEYSRYHQQNADWFRSFGDRLNAILAFKGQTEDEFMAHISSLQLSNEQKQELVKLRKEPMFKRLLGETALSQKADLENVLGVKLTSDGATLADENGAVVSVKSVKELDAELDSYSDKLEEKFANGQLEEEQRNNLEQQLDYIYAYFISRSNGEQIPFRKMTDREYERIEQQAMENRIDFSEQLNQINQDMRYDFDEVQETAHKLR